MLYYLTASLLLLTMPTFAEPLIVAHRGASHDAPENTLPAFNLAWKQGADAIEGDFHLTSDGEIICIHDYDTKRVAGNKRVVKSSSLAELRALDAGEWFKPEFKGTRLPTFAEVTATVPPGKKFYIEVKCGPEIVATLAKQIGKSGLKPSQIVVISFNVPVIREMKRIAPEFKACLLSSFAKKSPLDPAVDDVLTTLREIKADGFSSSADQRLDAGYVKSIREAGFEYHCWTVDKPEVAQRFTGFGALSITTNRPAFLREAIKSPTASTPTSQP
jgi:glycerophosphoryl diester phosphodiesterase